MRFLRWIKDILTGNWSLLDLFFMQLIFWALVIMLIGFLLGYGMVDLLMKSK